MTTSPSREQLKEILSSFPRLAVAFSGGVDSTLLLRAARDLLGEDRVLAVTVDAPVVPRRELEESRNLAAAMGIPQVILPCDPLRLPAFVGNDPLRCYRCKSLLLAACIEAAADLGFPHLAEGSNADDLNDWRPGMRAVRELGVRSPLLEAGLAKEQVREMSRELGLPTWEKPALACLATRIPCGTPITREALSRIEACEETLLRAGLCGARVRCHGETARIETDPAHFPLLLDPQTRAAVISDFKAAGFTFVSLDLEGYRTGSMNTGGTETAGAP